MKWFRKSDPYDLSNCDNRRAIVKAWNKEGYSIIPNTVIARGCGSIQRFLIIDGQWEKRGNHD